MLPNSGAAKFSETFVKSLIFRSQFVILYINTALQKKNFLLPSVSKVHLVATFKCPDYELIYENIAKNLLTNCQTLGATMNICYLRNHPERFSDNLRNYYKSDDRNASMLMGLIRMLLIISFSLHDQYNRNIGM